MREFNVTGLCIPEIHYMVNIDDKVESISRLVEHGKYFIISRPRQYGKTTTLNELKKRLSEKYIVIDTSFESLSRSAYSSEEKFIRKFVKLVEDSLIEDNIDKRLISTFTDFDVESPDIDDLGRNITRFVKAADKEIILMIDEVDKSGDKQIFLDFLGMLRSKYLSMGKGRDQTFKSVVLAGVHDTAHLKSKIRSDEEHTVNSPWNITASFKVDMSFSPQEISTMLVEYENDHHTGMDVNFISNEIYKFTSGYPFLVSYICKTIDEELDKNWSYEGILDAVKIFMNSDTNLGSSLIEKIENNEDLGSLIEHILVRMEPYEFVRSDEVIKKGIQYGILSSDENNRTVISNKIFETYIYKHLIAKRRRTSEPYMEIPPGSRFIKDGKLDMAALMDSFSIFMKTQALNKGRKFFEKECGLLFMAHINVATNGKGSFYEQVNVGDDKRIDLVVNYNNEDFIVEFKIWYGEKRHADAYKQLAGYMYSKNADKGYLLTISYAGGKSRNEWVDYHGNKIYDVVVKADPDIEHIKLKELKSLTIKAEKVQRELSEVIDSAKELDNK